MSKLSVNREAEVTELLNTTPEGSGVGGVGVSEISVIPIASRADGEIKRSQSAG